jgi:hypothetical protein
MITVSRVHTVGATSRGYVLVRWDNNPNECFMLSAEEAVELGEGLIEQAKALVPKDMSE